ncbi:MAG TPA: NDP-hexose 2,3-dehydratase family protein [bacterium]
MRLADLDVRREVAKLHRDLERVLMAPEESPGIDFLISSLTEVNPFNTTEEIIAWLDDLRRSEPFSVTQIPLSDLRQWHFDPETGDLVHATGGFFAICGLEVHTSVGPVPEWTQPIILQPQIGLLGIITKRINGILYLLMQAKAEPGNLNAFQLAPTVQATRSNYLRRHGGKSVRYLEYFLDDEPARVLFDQHQSEQGARFYRKRNRNIIVQVADDAEIEMGRNYRWMTLGQLKRLMLRDNAVNMDARSVISTICCCPERIEPAPPIHGGNLRDCLETSPLVRKPLNALWIKLLISACSDEKPRHSMSELLRMISRDKFQSELETRLISLNQVRDWTVSPMTISHNRDLYFSVIGVRVESSSREVSSWDQPIIKQQHAGIVGFMMREIDGLIHFLVQLKLESGNIDLLGMAPTVQCITGSYEVGDLPPYVGEMLKPAQSAVVFDTMQSEEGGRFFQESNRNLMLLGDETFLIEAPPRYHWISLRQLKQFLAFNNYLNVEARSLLAII